MFENYFVTGSVGTSSSDKMLEMYIFPTNMYSWLLGDGIISNADGSYYMYTDVGFIRLIFYWGLIATILFYLYRLYIVNSILVYLKNKPLQACMLVYFVFELICNLKGLVCGDVFLSWILIYLLCFQNKKYIV